MRRALAMLFVLGCATDPVVAPRDCTPGATSACACPGASGVQTCTAEGMLGACVCAGDGGVDATTEDRPALDAVTEDRPDVVGPDLCVCPDVPAQLDVVDAGPVRMCGDASVNLLEGVYIVSGPRTGGFDHCGACGASCTSGQRCTAGACGPRCPNGERAMCDGRMVDLVLGERDGGRQHHCGACGNTCATGEVCNRCVCSPP